MASNRLQRPVAQLRVRQRSLFTVALFTVLMLVGGTAWAYWTSAGSGSGLATTGTLLPPTNVLASNITGSTSVSVSWTAPTSGTAPLGYYVVRATNGATAPACGTSPTTLTSALSCTDTEVPDGTYTYAVTSVLRSWTAPSVASSTVVVTKAVATSTAVTSSANPSVTGQVVTFTASVTPASGSVKPTGSVTFSDSGTPITCTGGVQTLNAGTATCSLSYAVTGSHAVTAMYLGSASFTGSSSAAISQVVNASVVNTTTSLVSSSNPSVAGQSVTYTATVAQASGPSTPTGSVTFKDGTATISCTSGNQTLNASGTATCSLPYASTGTHTLTAVYSATAGFNASTSSVLTQTVNAASTTTALTASTATAKTSDTVTYTATVSPVSPGSGVPTGTVTFKEGSSVVSCAGGAQVLNGSGVATCQVAYAAIGTHTITAVYGGTSEFLTSTSALANVKVVQSRVAGLAFSNVTLGTAGVTPMCTGVIGAPSYTCTVSGTGNNAKISANVVFVDASGAPTVLSTVDENVTWSADGKTVVNGAALTMPAGTTTSSAVVTATKSGVNNVTITVTYGSWSATLKTSN